MKSNLISPVPVESPTLRFVVAFTPTLGANSALCVCACCAWLAGEEVSEPGAARGAAWPPWGLWAGLGPVAAGKSLH